MTRSKKESFKQPLVEGMTSFPVKPHWMGKDLLAKDAKDQQIKRTILGFKYEGNVFQAEIYVGPFRPMGLMLWDCPPRSWISQTLVGNQTQILASWDPIPTEFFTMAKSFEDIAKLLEEGYEPPGWPDFDAAHIGNRIRVAVIDDSGKPVGPPTRIAMWGLTAY